MFGRISRGWDLGEFCGVEGKCDLACTALLLKDLLDTRGRIVLMTLYGVDDIIL